MAGTHTRGHLVVPLFSLSPYYCCKFHGSVFDNFRLPFNCPFHDHLVCQVSITFNCDQVQCQNFNGSSQFSICLYHPFPLLLSPLSGYVNDKIENRIIWFPEKEMIFLVWLETCARAEVIYWKQKNTHTNFSWKVAIHRFNKMCNMSCSLGYCLNRYKDATKLPQCNTNFQQVLCISWVFSFKKFRLWITWIQFKWPAENLGEVLVWMTTEAKRQLQLLPCFAGMCYIFTFCS